MTSVSASRHAAVAGWLAGELRGWAASDGARCIFVARTLVAVFLSLWLAFRFSLDSPATAMTTTFILALPSSGMVLEKAFYRMLGTVVGCAASLALVACFPQHAPALYLGLALWMGLCTAGAAMYRNQQSYSFVLAGYTAVIIAVPSLDHATAVFSIAVTRVSEVGLGIICAAVASDTLFPRTQGPLVMRTVQARFESFLGLCRNVLEHRLPPSEAEISHLHFAADIAALESGRAAAFFEAAHSLTQTRQLHAFNEAFMTALTTFYTLHRLIHRASAQPDSPVPGLLEPLHRQLAAAMSAAMDGARGQAHGAAGAFEAAVPQLAAAIADARDALALSEIDSSVDDALRWRMDFDTAVELLARFATDIIAFASVYDGLAQRRRMQASEPRAYAPKTPPGIVAANGLRAALMLLAAAGIWYWLELPSLSSMVVMGAIFGALASSSPRPRRMLQQVMAGFLLAVPLCFATVFCLMVQAVDYPTLVLATMPLMALSAWLISNPQRAGMGVGMAMFSSIFLAPTSRMAFDAVNYFNVALAQLMGVGLAYVAFLALLPEHTMGNRKHVAAALWREALGACTARLPAASLHAARGLRHRFDNRVRDLLSQLNAAAGPTPNAETRAVVRDGLTLLELGHATIELRAVLATSPSPVVRDALQRVLVALAAHLRAPDDASGAAVCATVLAASPLLRAAVPDAAAERLPRLHTALTNLHAIYTSMLDQATASARYR
ncbi:FUSC family protein [Pseudoduganella sp. FT26W]|uniref:FUSC family protein n=1 Tax=Duganella aquatilis TaxID=2666082 RepID=A0A844D826_9BURK|nr:FUSC family protein [Duganella aquatilis]MRW84316.1 FUSC family protein [Duganella aquatilis]